MLRDYTNTRHSHIKVANSVVGISLEGYRL